MNIYIIYDILIEYSYDMIYNSYTYIPPCICIYVRICIYFQGRFCWGLILGSVFVCICRRYLEELGQSDGKIMVDKKLCPFTLEDHLNNFGMKHDQETLVASY